MNGPMSPALTSLPETREGAPERASVEALAVAPADAGTRPARGPRGSAGAARLTVAQVVRSLEVGGGEMLAAALAERLDRKRFCSVVFCLQEAGWLARDLASRGVRVVTFGAGEGVKPALVRRLWAAMRRERVDVAHCHNTMPLLYGGLAAVGGRGPAVVMTKHGMTFWRGWRQTSVARFLLRRAAVVAVSDEVYRALVRGRWAPEAQVRTILNGIDPERYRAGEGREEVRRELGWTTGEFVLGIVARLSPEKDHAGLLRAFALLTEAAPQARLAIIGDGPLRAGLEADAAALGLGDRCRFLGERRDVPSLLCGLDVFVLSSSREGTPLTLLEAMAAELPSVVTAVGGMPAVVLPEETGLLVPPGDPAALAAALARLAEAPELRRRMGAAGRRRIVERYSLDRMARDYEQLYADVAGRR
jgi:glycosyltransferase involved in cell wall biosynthesis